METEFIRGETGTTKHPDVRNCWTTDGGDSDIIQDGAREYNPERKEAVVTVIQCGTGV